MELLGRDIKVRIVTPERVVARAAEQGSSLPPPRARRHLLAI